MATDHTVKLLELSEISPPPGSVADTSLNLTLFDAFFLNQPNIRRQFFYELQPDITTIHFLTTLLPKLKHSLSLALQLFYPLAGNLTHSPELDEPIIRYVEGDSVSMTVAESDTDFHHLISNDPRDVSELHPLFPQLQPPSLLSLQVTVFPNSGISIGYNVRHVIADGATLAHFMKSWASVCRSGDAGSITSLPFYDRKALHADLDHVKKKIMKKFKEGGIASEAELPTGNVRATFLLSRANIERLSRRAPPGCSPFVLTCAHLWVCVMRAQGDGEGEAIEDETVQFVCPVNLRGRLDRALPDTYFGNCLGGCFAEAKWSDLVKGDGMECAAEAIRATIRRYLDSDILKGLENTEWKLSRQNVIVGGSPKLRAYNTDFGWGKPKKTELLSARKGGTIYVGDSREEGGIEVGFSLPADEMHRFASFFEEGLKVDP